MQFWEKKSELQDVKKSELWEKVAFTFFFCGGNFFLSVFEKSFMLAKTTFI